MARGQSASQGRTARSEGEKNSLYNAAKSAYEAQESAIKEAKAAREAYEADSKKRGVAGLPGTSPALVRAKTAYEAWEKANAAYIKAYDAYEASLKNTSNK